MSLMLMEMCPKCKGKFLVETAAYKTWWEQKESVLSEWYKNGSNLGEWEKVEKTINDLPSPICNICGGKGVTLTPDGKEVLKLIDIFVRKKTI